MEIKMKKIAKIAVSALALAGIATATTVASTAPAEARVSIGIGLGVPAYYGGYYGPPAVAYVQPTQPMVLAAQPQPPVWYYCASSGKYFPYAQDCATGWQVQPAMPPSSNVVSQPN